MESLDPTFLYVKELFLTGIYNETFEVLPNGGPICASKSTLGFKFILCMILLPYQLILYTKGLAFFAKHHELKRRLLIKTGRGINPSFLEICQGLLCFGMIAFQIYSKFIGKSMIYIFNPCHVVTFTFGLVSILPYNKFSDVLMTFSVSSTFGAWIGIVFAENAEMTDLELIMYYVQHSFAAFIAPLVMFQGGRYSVTDQFRFPLPIFGFTLFSLYMRYFLTPLSALTWANLNHTLCGVNDPWMDAFDMGEYYYFWSEFYLCMASMTTQLMLFALGKCMCKESFTIRIHKE